MAMSEPEASTAVIDLEGNYRTIDVELPEVEEVPEAPVKSPVVVPKEKPKEKPQKKSKPEAQTKIAELKVQHKNKIQEILKKHAEERRELQKEIKEQAKRSREDLGKALKQTEKIYTVQLEKLRQESETRNVKLQNELETFLAVKMGELQEHNSQIVTNDSQERIEKLQEWLHGEFVTELQNKTNELEQTKAASDTQVQNLVHEVDRKNHEILSLKNKIKEISQHVKKGLREEIYDEMGFTDDDEDHDRSGKKKKKPQKMGFFARLSKM